MRLIDLEELEALILEPLDREYFREATECYSIGSYRAAIILCWNLTCYNLKRKLQKLAKEDGDAMSKLQPIEQKEKSNTSFEEDLLNAFESLGILTDSEKKSVSHVRQLRHYSAHPSGYHVSAEEVRSSFRVCVNTVLSRPYYRGHSFITGIEEKLKDPMFLPSKSYFEVIAATISPLRPDLLPKLVQRVIEVLKISTEQIVKNNTQKVLESVVGYNSSADIKSRIVNEISVLKDIDIEILSNSFARDGEAIEYLDFPCRERVIRFLIDEKPISILETLSGWRRETLMQFIKKEIELKSHKDWVIQLVREKIRKVPHIVNQIPEHFKEFTFDSIISDLEYSGWGNFDVNNRGSDLLTAIGGLDTFSDFDGGRKVRLLTALNDAARAGSNEPKAYLKKFPSWKEDWRKTFDQVFDELLAGDKVDGEVALLYMKDKLESGSDWSTAWDSFFLSRDASDYRPKWYRETSPDPLKNIINDLTTTMQGRSLTATCLVDLLNRIP